MAGELTDGAARSRVASIYGIFDLLGSHAALADWAQGLSEAGGAERLMPSWLSPDSQGVMAAHLHSCGVIDANGGIDGLRLAELQAAVALVPHFHEQEAARLPEARARIVFTVPPQAPLPEQASHMRRQLVIRVADALASVNEHTGRVMLAGPYWSSRGAEQLLDAFDRTVACAIPVVFAGARDDDQRSDLRAMRRFAGQVADRHPTGQVTALEFVPPTPTSLFHAKLALGWTGYLGSANFTGPGLGEHVEAGLALDAVDVERAWWLMDVLTSAGMLRDVSL
jgi:hypothetical protein